MNSHRLLLSCSMVWLLLLTIAGTELKAQLPAAAYEDLQAHLQKALDEKDFFQLERLLARQQQLLPVDKQLYFQTYLDNAFNRNENTVEHANALLANYGSQLSARAKAELYRLKAESHFRLFEYAAAARADSTMLTLLAPEDSNHRNDFSNKLIIYNGLKEIPAQQIAGAPFTSIAWKKNKLGIVEIPLHCHAAVYQAVFDTRANISVVTQSFAKKLRLQSLPVVYYEGSGITGIRFATSLAVADSLQIGQITLRHVVFQVVPDSVLYIAPVPFQINIIVGFPVIAQMGEIHFYKDGRMQIRVDAKRPALHNMALDGLNPVIVLRTSGGDSLPFAFDFGASRTMLFASYFRKYKQWVLANAVKTTTEYGGAGGIRKKQVLTLPTLPLYLNNRKVLLRKIDVLQEEVFAGETFYGNIGQDFITQFDELVMNFLNMSIQAR